MQAELTPWATMVCGHVTVRELGYASPFVPRLPTRAAWGGLEAALSPAGASVGCTLSHPASPTHSEPDESSSTVPALILMAMGMTPFSCSWRLCRGGGRGGGPPRLPSLAEEPLEDPVPCSKGSRKRLLFSLMVGRHFFLRMPVGRGSRRHEKQVGGSWGCSREPYQPQGKCEV